MEEVAPSPPRFPVPLITFYRYAKIRFATPALRSSRPLAPPVVVVSLTDPPAFPLST